MEHIIKALVNSPWNSGERIEIHYKDGTIIEGSVKYVNHDFNPPVVIIMPYVEDDHEVNFKNISKVIIKSLGKNSYILEP